MPIDRPSMSLVGVDGLLLDASCGAFSESVQRRLLSLGSAIRKLPGVIEVVPCMNNLLTVFDPETMSARQAEIMLLTAWEEATAAPDAGRRISIPVVYGGPRAEDFPQWAAHCGLSHEEAASRHASCEYRVGAVGAMPGFPYVSGLDPALAMPRRSTPRTRVPAGAVMVGGSQTGVLPIASPTGWNVIGFTNITLFDPDAAEPSTLRPGDRISFEIVGLLS